MSGIIADYHMHSTISPDGFSTAEEMCQAAIDRGLQEIAMTEHFEIYTPGFTPDGGFYTVFDEETLRQSQKAYEQCKRKFDGQLVIRHGLEVGQPQVNPEFVKRVMSGFAFDYLIGSAHKMQNIDLSMEDYATTDLNNLALRNLEAIYTLVNQEDFDCLGHIDLIKRYAAKHGKKVLLRDYPDELGDIFKRLIERGKGIEINTSALRQEAKETLPSLPILKLYRDLGGEIVTVGSDAHRTTDVAAGFDTVYHMLREAGFTHVALYENRNCHFYAIDE